MTDNYKPMRLSVEQLLDADLWRVVDENRNVSGVFKKREHAVAVALAPEMKEALEGLVHIIEKAGGPEKLMRGVDLGQVSWMVKCSDQMRYANTILDRLKTRGGGDAN